MKRRPERGKSATHRALFANPQPPARHLLDHGRSIAHGDRRLPRTRINFLVAESRGKNERAQARAIISGSLKYISHAQGQIELFDVAADPAEERNLYRSDDVRAKQLHTIATQWAANASKLNLPKTKSPAALDAELLERLRSLGYVQ